MTSKGYLSSFVEGTPATSFQTARAPMVLFNYLGDVSGEGEKGEYFEPDSADGFSAGLDYYDPRNYDGSDLMVNCLVDGGRFTLWLDYNSGRFAKAQAQSFARSVLDHITALADFLNAQSEALAKTASDLGETEWSCGEFERVVAEFAARGETLERIYPLTPMQEGMLLEHVAHPESRAYRLIDIYECVHPLDEAQLRYAVDAMAERHEVLRTAIIHKGVSRFRQAIVNRKLPLTIVDLTDSDDPFAEAQRIRLDILDNGYDLQDRPLTRFVYCRTARGGYLIFATHHIITDGWCFETILRDLNALLRGEALTGNSNGQYEQAVREQLNRDHNAAAAYFTKLLAGYENSAILPSWGEVPEAERDADDQIRSALPAGMTEKLSALCKSVGATLADGFNLAWGLVLRTLNRTDDVVFTSIASGRDGYSLDVSDLVGLFINPVPVRLNPGKDATARQALDSLNRQAANTKPHDFFPLADIQKALGRDIRLSGLIISFENYSENAPDSALLRPALIREEHEAGSVDVDATVQPDGSISMLLSYDPALYRGRDMARLVRLFENYVARMVERPDVPLHALPHLSEADLQAVFALSKGESMPCDANQTWLDLFMAQSARTPDAPAVSDEKGVYTYAELDRASDSVAACLIDKGVQENGFVAIRMGREKEFLAAAIGAHKAGAAYVPIDPEYPRERIDYMLKDSGAGVLLTAEDVRAAVVSHPNPAPVNRATPKHRAYMIYTSGSTGLPKGVMIPHSALGNFVRFIAKRWGLTAHSRVALHSSFSFDAAVEDLFPALTVGGTVFVVPERARKDVFEMRKCLSENHLNAGCYSTQFGQLLGMDAPLDVDYICVGGEAMTSVPQCRGRVYNTYGPTEFTVDATYFELDKEKHYRNIPIGRPLDNCAAYVLDAQGRLLPRGMTGELCLSGPQLAEGYWNRPELTAEKFTHLTLPNGEKVRIYKTGDLVRWNDDDQLEFYGRIDFQVKLRGFRIELGEIENVAMACPGVSAAVAEVKKSGVSQILCLYYTEKNGQAVDVEALKALCKQRLTDYMVPSAFIRLDEMPLSPSGKVNRRALPMPELEARVDIIEPATETERVVCAIVSEILGMGGFSVTANLTELGLSSISIMRLSALIDKALNRHVTVGDIMRQPTIRALAAMLDGQDEGTVKRDFTPEAELAARRGTFPVTVGQLSMVDYQFTHSKSVMYNLPMLCRFDASVDAQRLADALNAVIRQHPALTTVLEFDENGNVTQRNRPELFPDVRVEDIPGDQLKAVLKGLVYPFKLFGAPLCRVRVIRGNGHTYLFCDMHHTISDGTSIDILMEDIAKAWRGEPLEQDYYYCFLQKESRERGSEDYRRSERYFRELLGDGHWHNVPTPDHDTWDTEPGEERLDMELTLRDIAGAEARHGASGNVMCITAAILALQEYCHQHRILVNWLNSNRGEDYYDHTVGMLFRLLPVAVHTERYGSLKALIAEVGRQVAEGFAHSNCDYMENTEQALEDSLEVNYLVGIGNSDPLAALGGETLSPDYEYDAVGERVGVYIEYWENTLGVTIGYQKKAYADGSMARFLAMFKKYLRYIVLERE